MSAANRPNEPGGFARRRYRQRRRRWLRRVLWAFPMVLALPIVAEALVALVLRSHLSGFAWGFGVGAAAGAALVLADSPPSYIANWRTGAEGERATAKALRPLLKKGWIVLHDLQTEHGNIDHLLVGPAGVFMLETKNLNGTVSVSGARLKVRWREDPEEGYENDAIARRAKAAATAVHDALVAGSSSTWVQPVVVLWADFPQRTLQSGDVAWVAGRELAKVLDARPERLNADQIARAAAVLSQAYA